MASKGISLSVLLLTLTMVAIGASATYLDSPDPKEPGYLNFVSNATDFPSEDYYDYIIVGAGTAGCPLAATLSSRFQVLLLEQSASACGSEALMTHEGFFAAFVDLNPSDSADIITYNGYGFDRVVGTKTGGSTHDTFGRSFTGACLLKYDASPLHIKVAVHATVERLLLASFPIPSSSGAFRKSAVGVIFRDAIGKHHHAMLNKHGQVFLSTGATSGTCHLFLQSGNDPRPTCPMVHPFHPTDPEFCMSKPLTSDATTSRISRAVFTAAGLMFLWLVYQSWFRNAQEHPEVVRYFTEIDPYDPPSPRDDRRRDRSFSRSLGIHLPPPGTLTRRRGQLQIVEHQPHHPPEGNPPDHHPEGNPPDHHPEGNPTDHHPEGNPPDHHPEGDLPAHHPEQPQGDEQQNEAGGDDDMWAMVPYQLPLNHQQQQGGNGIVPYQQQQQGGNGIVPYQHGEHEGGNGIVPYQHGEHEGDNWGWVNMQQPPQPLLPPPPEGVLILYQPPAIPQPGFGAGRRVVLAMLAVIAVGGYLAYARFWNN